MSVVRCLEMKGMNHAKSTWNIVRIWNEFLTKSHGLFSRSKRQETRAYGNGSSEKSKHYKNRCNLRALSGWMVCVVVFVLLSLMLSSCSSVSWKSQLISLSLPVGYLDWMRSMPFGTKTQKHFSQPLSPSGLEEEQ